MLLGFSVFYLLVFEEPQILTIRDVLAQVGTFWFDQVVLTGTRCVCSDSPLPFSSHLRSILCHMCLMPPLNALC